MSTKYVIKYSRPYFYVKFKLSNLYRPTDMAILYKASIRRLQVTYNSTNKIIITA